MPEEGPLFRLTRDRFPIIIPWKETNKKMDTKNKKKQKRPYKKPSLKKYSQLHKIGIGY